MSVVDFERKRWTDTMLALEPEWTSWKKSDQEVQVRLKDGCSPFKIFSFSKQRKALLNWQNYYFPVKLFRSHAWKMHCISV